MSEHVTLLHDLDAGKNCSGEAAAAIRDLEQRIDEQREKVATWIMSLGLSTGHGDTLEDLLKEAHWQVREYQQRIALGIRRIVEFDGYGPNMPRVYLPVENIVRFHAIDFNGNYGTEIVLPEGRYIRVSASPEEVKARLMGTVK